MIRDAYCRVLRGDVENLHVHQNLAARNGRDTARIERALRLLYLAIGKAEVGSVSEAKQLRLCSTECLSGVRSTVRQSVGPANTEPTRGERRNAYARDRCVSAKNSGARTNRTPEQGLRSYPST